MTRILLVGDIHLSDRPPVNATESYTQDILEMLSYIADLEEELNTDAVVWAGDVFHHKQPSRTSHALVLRTVEVVQRYRNLWIVPGNHDVSNDRLESIDEKQPLGILFKAGAQLLDGWHPDLPLYGVPWQMRWTTDEDALWDAFENWRGEGHIEGSDKLRHSLAVTHAPIFPEGLEPPYEYLSLADINQAMDLSGYLYYGHIHDYHGIYEYGGITLCNVGALSRGSLTESNLTRPIKVALWTEDGFEEIDIPHRPASEIFKLEEASERKEHELSLDEFLSEVGRSTLEVTTTESVRDLINKMKLKPSVKKLALEILEQVDE